MSRRHLCQGVGSGVKKGYMREVIDTPTISDVLWQADTKGRDQSRVDDVYKRLWQRIVEGEHQQGERLIENDLAQELGVSRTPVRQALFQLQQAGLVRADKNRGFHVIIFSADDICDLYDLRAVLELAALRAAAPHLTPAPLKEALEHIATLRQTPEPELSPRFLQSDIAFHHQLIAERSGNRRLAEALASSRAQMSIFIAEGTRVAGGIGKALSEHEQIAEALLRGDVDGAVGAMQRHLERVKNMALADFAALRPVRIRRFSQVVGR